MDRPGWTRGVGFRIAAAAVLTTAIGVGIVTLGVLLVGADTFTRLMTEHGTSTETAHAMFDESVTRGPGDRRGGRGRRRRRGRDAPGEPACAPPGRDRPGGPAHRRGDYRARVPREGPAEVAGLANSFNQMAASLEDGERIRREFIGNAAHELRTPLTNLKGYLEGLRDGVIPADEATFMSLSEEVERLVRLAASLDTLAAGDADATPAPLMELDLIAAIRTAVELAGPAMDRVGISLQLELPEQQHVRADPDGLAQVLGNLLQNASRYTPPGGRVAIRAERRPGEVLVSVVNTGPGIPAADLPHVFERFYRVDKSRDRSRGGAGIGLGHRQAARRGGRRQRRGRIQCRAHAVLVQPPGLRRSRTHRGPRGNR